MPFHTSVSINKQGYKLHGNVYEMTINSSFHGESRLTDMTYGGIKYILKIFISIKTYGTFIKF